MKKLNRKAEIKELELRVIKAAIAHVRNLMWETYGDPQKQEEKDKSLLCWCSPKHAKRLVSAVNALHKKKATRP